MKKFTLKKLMIGLGLLLVISVMIAIAYSYVIHKQYENDRRKMSFLWTFDEWVESETMCSKAQFSRELLAKLSPEKVNVVDTYNLKFDALRKKEILDTLTVNDRTQYMANPFRVRSSLNYTSADFFRSMQSSNKQVKAKSSLIISCRLDGLVVPSRMQVVREGQKVSYCEGLVYLDDAKLDWELLKSQYYDLLEEKGTVWAEYELMDKVLKSDEKLMSLAKANVQNLPASSVPKEKIEDFEAKTFRELKCGNGP